MNPRLPVIVFLVLACVLFAARPTESKNVSQVESREPSSDEKSEARNLAVQLMMRLEQTDDFGPLMSEFFIRDYTVRVQKFFRDSEISDSDYLNAGITKEMVLSAGRNELQRACVAMMNFWRQLHLLNESRLKLAAVNPIATEQALPSGFYALANQVPMLGRLAEFVDEPGEKSGNKLIKTSDEAVRRQAIRTVENLRIFTSSLEKFVGFMREAVSSLQSEEEKQFGFSAAKRKTAADYQQEIYRVELRTLRNRTAGFPVGTRLLSVRMFPYVVLMTRVEGSLKVVAVLPDMDGD
jgi:hypothetical protein